MDEMTMYLMKELNEFKVKMAQVETMLIENEKKNKEDKELMLRMFSNQSDRDRDINKALLSLKKEVGQFIGRTDDRETNITLENNTNVESKGGNASQDTNLKSERDINTGDIHGN